MVVNMKTFQNGELVETNEDYFKMFGRKVVGEVLRPLETQPSEVTIVRWLEQEGNQIQAHQGNVVLMMTKDLQYFLQ